MADAALASAKAKVEEAKRLQPEGRISAQEKQTQNQLVQSKASEALYLAQDALVSFRRAGESEKKVAALKAVVDSNVLLGNSFDALMAAQDELAMIKRTGDKKAQVATMQIVADVQVARGDNGSALQTLQETLELQRELGNKSGEAKALEAQARVKLAMGRNKEAVTAATQATGLFQDLGDAEGETAAQRTMNKAYAEMGQLEKAPNRPEALRALEDLALAVENRDKRAYDSAMAELKKSSAYTQKDVEATLGRAMAKDRRASAAFLRDMGVSSPGSGAPELIIKEVMKTITYINFRVGGLGYGPRFRCLQSYVMHVRGQPDTAQAIACLKISEEADDWEKELAYHPGVLDGMLQSQSAFGHM